MDRPAIPPFVDVDFDQTPWYHAPANLPAQPNFLSLTFSASTSLLLIARKIVDVVYVVLAFFGVPLFTSPGTACGDAHGTMSSKTRTLSPRLSPSSPPLCPRRVLTLNSRQLGT
jgi:hypothetical protein